MITIGAGAIDWQGCYNVGTRGENISYFWEQQYLECRRNGYKAIAVDFDGVTSLYWWGDGQGNMTIDITDLIISRLNLKQGQTYPTATLRTGFTNDGNSIAWGTTTYRPRNGHYPLENKFLPGIIYWRGVYGEGELCRLPVDDAMFTIQKLHPDGSITDIDTVANNSYYRIDNAHGAGTFIIRDPDGAIFQRVHIYDSYYEYYLNCTEDYFIDWVSSIGFRKTYFCKVIEVGWETTKTIDMQSFGNSWNQIKNRQRFCKIKVPRVDIYTMRHLSDMTVATWIGMRSDEDAARPTIFGKPRQNSMVISNLETEIYDFEITIDIQQYAQF